VQELPRFAQPKPAIGFGFRFRDQNFAGKLDELCMPAGPQALRATPTVAQKAVEQRIAVVVERPIAASNEDMVADPRLGPQPKRFGAKTEVPLQKSVGQNMASAGRKKTRSGKAQRIAGSRFE